MQLVNQQDDFDCGPSNCVMLINYFNKKNLTLTSFKIDNNYNKDEYSLLDIKQKLEKYNIDSDFYEIKSVRELIKDNFPFLLVVKNDKGLNHYVLVTEFKDSHFKVYDPSNISITFLTIDELENISLNYIGVFTKVKSAKTNSKKNNKKIIKLFSFLFKMNWKSFLFLNLISCINIFIYLLSNLFLRVILSEYSYLTNNRVTVLLVMFMFLLVIWLMTSYLLGIYQTKLTNNSISKLFIKGFKKYDIVSDLSPLSNKETIEQLKSWISTLNSMYYILNNLISTSLFTFIVVILTYNISVELMLSTLLLIGILTIIKIFKSVKGFKYGLAEKQELYEQGLHYNLFINNIRSLTNKTDIFNYLKTNKNNLNNKKFYSTNRYVFLERTIIYVYYVFVLFILQGIDFDIATFLVVSNIVFLYSSLLEKQCYNFLNINMYKDKLIDFNLKIKSDISLNLSKQIVSYKSEIITTNYIYAKNTKDILIDYLKFDDFEKQNLVYDTNTELIKNESVSNNLFNYGINEGLDLFQKLNLIDRLDKLNIDLSSKIEVLNEEQKEFIKLSSCLFTTKQIIKIKESKYKWSKELIDDIKNNLTDKLVVIIYE